MLTRLIISHDGDDIDEEDFFQIRVSKHLIISMHGYQSEKERRPTIVEDTYRYRTKTPRRTVCSCNSTSADHLHGVHVALPQIASYRNKRDKELTD